MCIPCTGIIPEFGLLISTWQRADTVVWRCIRLHQLRQPGTLKSFRINVQWFEAKMPDGGYVADVYTLWVPIGGSNKA